MDLTPKQRAQNVAIQVAVVALFPGLARRDRERSWRRIAFGAVAHTLIGFALTEWTRGLRAARDATAAELRDELGREPTEHEITGRLAS